MTRTYTDPVVLAAVQPYMTLADYASEKSFGQKLATLMAPLASEKCSVLAVLPEDIGAFLGLAGAAHAVRRSQTLDAAFRAIALRQLPQIAHQRLFHGARDLREALHLVLSPRVGRVYRRTICGLAKELGIWIVGGSALLPKNRYGADPDAFAPQGHAVYNVSITADPSGQIVSTVQKVNLVPTQEEQLGLTPGDPDQASTFSFAGHRTGVAICYDGFTKAHTAHEPSFCPVAPYLARAGAEIIAQPSANPWPWEEAWPLDPQRTRKDAWTSESLEASMASLPTVRYGINAQLLAGFLGLHFDGRSRIFGRTPDGTVQVIAEAPRADLSPEAECLVRACVEFPDWREPDKVNQTH